MEIIWHYTSINHFEMIVKDQFLKVSEAERKFGLRPAIWFSKNPVWEPTATKMTTKGVLTLKEQFELIGMIRIGVEFTNAMISWSKYRYLSKISLPLYNNMTKIGIEKGGNPLDWYCLFSNVPISKWITVEQFDGEKWVSIIDEENNESTN